MMKNIKQDYYNGENKSKDAHLIIEHRWEWRQGDKLTVTGHRSEKTLVGHQAALVGIMMIMIMMGI